MGIITITGRIPSKKNSRRPFIRGGRVMNFTSKNYVDWNKDALLQLKGQEKIPSNTWLTLNFYMPDNRKCDLTNKAESIMDTLVDAGILEDDCWQVVPDITLHFCGVDKENPRCEVIW